MGGEHVVRIKCKKDPNYVISAHPTKGIILVPVFEEDIYQLWLIDDSWRDLDAFVLIHKATGKALQAPLPHHQVSLVEYNPTQADKSVFWTWRFGDDQGYGSLQSLSFDFLFLDVCEERVETGSQILLWEWASKPHKFWSFQYVDVVYTIRSKLSSQFALAAMPGEDGIVISMAALEENDASQLWKLVAQPNQSFVLRNVAHSLVLRKHESNDSLCLGDSIPLNSVLWEVGKNEGGNYFALRLKSNPSLNLDAVSGKVHHKSGVTLYRWKKPKGILSSDKNLHSNQIWGFFPLLEERPVRPV